MSNFAKTYFHLFSFFMFFLWVHPVWKDPVLPCDIVDLNGQQNGGFLQDVNGDGLVDVICNSYGAGTSHKGKVYLNTGCEWKPATEFSYCEYGKMIFNQKAEKTRITLRRFSQYEGGFQIEKPTTLENLLQLGHSLFGEPIVAFRNYETKAKLVHIDTVKNEDILLVTTKEEEIHLEKEINNVGLQSCGKGNSSQYWLPMISTVSSQILNNHMYSSFDHTFCQFVDINGDGLVDYSCNLENQGKYWRCLYLNNGTGWTLVPYPN